MKKTMTIFSIAFIILFGFMTPAVADIIPIAQEEDINITIQEDQNGLHASFSGEFTFNEYAMWLSYFLPDIMLFPLPPNSTNIKVWQDDVELDWIWSESKYWTILPEMETIPMIEWEPFLSSNDIIIFRIEYEHKLIERPDEFIFLYASGVGFHFPYDYGQYFTKANFSIEIPKGYTIKGVWLDEKDCIYQLEDYSVKLVIHSTEGDLIVPFIEESTSEDCNTNGIPDEKDIRPPLDFSNETDYDIYGDITYADFNGDQAPDIPIAGDSSVSVLVNDGFERFMQPLNDSFSPNPVFVEYGDYNNDGCPHLVVESYNKDSSSLTVLLNNDCGTFSLPVSYEIEVSDLWSYSDEEPIVMIDHTTCADFNGDKHPDLCCLVIINDLDIWEEKIHLVFLNNGSGYFYYNNDSMSSGILLSYKQEYEYVYGDFDSDGDLDLLNNPLKVFLDNDKCIFAAGPEYEIRWGSSIYSAVDFDSNGTLDLALVYDDYFGLSEEIGFFVLSNRGDGTFIQKYTEVMQEDISWEDPQYGPIYYDYDFVDLNNDSLIDIVIRDSDGGVLSVRLSPQPTSQDFNNNNIPDECELCEKDADCDDGLFCNGEEICDDEFCVCVSNGDPCAPDLICDENNDFCIECFNDEDCNDGNVCTDDSCDTTSNKCMTTQLTDGTSCDDGFYCNGIETCEQGVCLSHNVPCLDDLFCNGEETCNETHDFCKSSGNPCSLDEECDEEEDICKELCEITIEPKTTSVQSGQTLNFNIIQVGDCNDPNYEWLVDSTIGSRCNQNGKYIAGINFDKSNPVKDVVRVIDDGNGGILAEAEVIVYFGCLLMPIYGENSKEIETLRCFRDNVLNTSPEGQELMRLYYEWSPMIVKAMGEDEVFKENIKEMIDEILVVIAGAEE